MTKQVYTFGYQGRTPAALKAFAERIDALVFDIRFSPRSRQPLWSQAPLGAILKERYVAVPSLGNRNYNNDGPISLVDFAEGLRTIQAAAKPVILMCVCRDAAGCHRTAVAQRLPNYIQVVEVADADLYGEPTL